MRMLSLLILLPHLALALIRVPQDVGTIQAGIDQAMSGDTVLIAPGVWTERVQISSGNVTICSNYIFSHDSSDIVNTVLDGEFEGTIISVEMDPTNRLELNGLTLTRGEGNYEYNTDNTTGGAIDVLSAGTIDLFNLVFHNNHAPRNGAAMYYMETNPLTMSHVTLYNVNCYSNEGNDPQNSYHMALDVGRAKCITARRLRISAEHITYAQQYAFRAADSMIVSDCSFSHLDSLVAAPLNMGASDFGYAHYLSVSDFSVMDNTFSMGGGFYLTSGRNVNIKLHNIHMERNFFPQGGMRFDIMGYGRFEADSIFICHNESRKSYALFNNSMPGTFRDLFVIGNHMGSNTHFTPTGGRDPIMYDVSFNGAVFQDNINERALEDAYDYVYGGSLLYIRCQSVDSLFYRNMQFINNLHIDHDVYDMQDLCLGITIPNFGRLICGFIDRDPAYFLMDSCQFIGNHQDNMVPEVECLDLPGGTYFIGNNVLLWDYGDTAETEMDLRNIQMIDCDDGAIWVNGRRRMTLENFEIIDCKRQGMVVGNGSLQDDVIIRNILISGIQQQECYTTPPFESCRQSALACGFAQNLDVNISNITITDCDVPFLIRNSTDDINRRIKNSIFYDNTIAYMFEHPLGAPLLFDHCLLPNPHDGVGNLWGMDPGFDHVLGPPWLAADSPCVDAGDPDLSYNDIEDPLHSDFALWPSQGGLRNDIGYTGGPHASLLDTNWVSALHWEPSLPSTISLGAPWPNPFNPLTRIPFTLSRPMPVRLAVHNLLGQEVAVLVDGMQAAGQHQVAFKPGRLASGLYLVTLEAEGRAETRTVTLLR